MQLLFLIPHLINEFYRFINKFVASFRTDKIFVGTVTPAFGCSFRADNRCDDRIAALKES
jgi:hypothetical protein